MVYQTGYHANFTIYSANKGIISFNIIGKFTIGCSKNIIINNVCYIYFWLNDLNNLMTHSHNFSSF